MGLANSTNFVSEEDLGDCDRSFQTPSIQVTPQPYSQMVLTRGSKRSHSELSLKELNNSPGSGSGTTNSEDTTDSKKSRYTLRARQSPVNYAEKKQKRAPSGTLALYAFGFLTEKADSADCVNSDILSSLETKEEHKVAVSYIGATNGVNPKMRAILVDWMMEVCEDYKLHRETLQLAVLIVDRFLSTQRVTKSKLQLLGVTAMHIAAKLEEIEPPKIVDFIHATDEAYCPDDVRSMELVVLQALSWEVVRPTAYFWINVLLKRLVNQLQGEYDVVTVDRVVKPGVAPTVFASKHGRDEKTPLPELLVRMCHILDCALLDPTFCTRSPKVVAIAALSMALNNFGALTALVENDNMPKGWIDEVFECEEWLLEFTGISILEDIRKLSRDALRKKFQHQSHSTEWLEYVGQLPSVLSNSPPRKTQRSRSYGDLKSTTKRRLSPSPSLDLSASESLVDTPVTVKNFVITSA